MSRTLETRQKEKLAADPDDRAVLEAMDEVAGYLDITPEDFLDVLHHIRHGVRKDGSGLEGRLEEQETGAVAPRSPGRFLADYFAKFRGNARAPHRVSFKEILWSWFGSFLGILAVAYMNYVTLGGSDLVMIIGSFGASAVLIYGAIKSPLAQPRNLVGGHILSALVGAGLYMILPEPLFLTSALAVSLSIALMHATRTLHPPRGATTLIAVIGSQKIHALGFWYALIPAGAGALVMLLIAVLVNNLARERSYPEYWI